ncbi:hypothetical protein D9758_012075 [Tetrapyrgos nigripes]|uniref:Peptidase C14 caspase domain-containing protein n=1 Tax=Tetrapyrgos nigripes TaxID=182062 RepID=A0A8H5CBJ8_9AGAR|nr:hypothetical protein D9758_012075 [Tetrapyrgos nigripes]
MTSPHISDLMSALPSTSSKGFAANASGFKHIFAVVIGINKYKNLKPALQGCISDVEDVISFLEHDLDVPGDRIVRLLGENATRDAIIGALKNLQNNKKIPDNDPILIYFAGHGASIDSNPPLQTITSWDMSSDESDEAVDVIADWEIRDLLNKLEGKKGNNITVIFDCCYSGSGTRATESMTFQSAEVPAKRIPAQDRASTFGAYAQKESRSHILLAACTSAQKAAESGSPRRGDFTSKLLEFLRQLLHPESKIPLAAISYSRLIQLLGQLPRGRNQTPQCEGYYQNRFLFSCRQAQVTFPLQRIENGQIVVQGGEVHGVTVGSQFCVVGSSGNGQELKIQKTKLLHSTFTPPLAPLLMDLATDLQLMAVTKTMSGHKERLPVHLHLSLDDSLTEALLAEMPADLICTEHSEQDARLVIVKEKDTETDTDYVAFKLTDERITSHGLTSLYSPVNASISGILPYRLRTGLDVKFLGLQKNPDPYSLEERVIRDENLISDEKIITLVIDRGDDPTSGSSYGIRLTNNSRISMYPYVFYFDNSDLSIRSASYYEPPSAHNQKVKPPLTVKGVLSIGYWDKEENPGATPPISYRLRDGQDADVGFLKVFLTTHYVDMSSIAQGHLPIQVAPFKLRKNVFLTNRKDVSENRLAEKFDWDSFVIPIYQKAANPS